MKGWLILDEFKKNIFLMLLNIYYEIIVQVRIRLIWKDFFFQRINKLLRVVLLLFY